MRADSVLNEVSRYEMSSLLAMQPSHSWEPEARGEQHTSPAHFSLSIGVSGKSGSTPKFKEKGILWIWFTHVPDRTHNAEWRKIRVRYHLLT